jgi:hypothetical protein
MELDSILTTGIAAWYAILATQKILIQHKKQANTKRSNLVFACFLLVLWYWFLIYMT